MSCFYFHRYWQRFFSNHCTNKNPASTQRCKVQDKEIEECTGKFVVFQNINLKLPVVHDPSLYNMRDGMVLKSQSIGPILCRKCDQFLQGENMQILPKLTRNGQIFPNFHPFAPIWLNSFAQINSNCHDTIRTVWNYRQRNKRLWGT